MLSTTFVRQFRKLPANLQRRIRAGLAALAEELLESLPRQVRQVLGEIPDPRSAFDPANVAQWFDVSTKTARHWLSHWVREGHFEPTKPTAARVRAYRVTPTLRKRLDDAGLA